MKESTVSSAEERNDEMHTDAGTHSEQYVAHGDIAAEIGEMSDEEVTELATSLIKLPKSAEQLEGDLRALNVDTAGSPVEKYFRLERRYNAILFPFSIWGHKNLGKNILSLLSLIALALPLFLIGIFIGAGHSAVMEILGAPEWLSILSLILLDGAVLVGTYFAIKAILYQLLTGIALEEEQLAKEITPWLSENYGFRITIIPIVTKGFGGRIFTFEYKLLDRREVLMLDALLALPDED